MVYFNYSFAGKRIMVTGAGRGLGKDLVRALVENKAEVVAVSLTQSKLDDLKKEFPKIQCIQCDLGNADQVEKVIPKAMPIHSLVNNAAINIPGLMSKCPIEDVEKTINTNVRGPFLVTQMVARDMVKRRAGGNIVTVSSVVAKIAVPMQGVYGMSKAGLGMMNRMFSMELGPENIRVNTCNPGVFPSDMSAKSMANKKGMLYTKVTTMATLHRTLTVEEVSNVVLYLLSDLSPGLTGQSVYVCAGFTAHAFS